MRRLPGLCLIIALSGCSKQRAELPVLMNAPGVTIFANASSVARVGDLLFLSGVIGVKPGTRDLVEGGIGPETRQALETIRTVLRSSSATLENIAKCTVFLTNFSDAPKMNEVYSEFFPQKRPARSTVQIAGLARGAHVEIECIATVPK